VEVDVAVNAVDHCFLHGKNHNNNVTECGLVAAAVAAAVQGNSHQLMHIGVVAAHAAEFVFMYGLYMRQK
jgi:hypothetical protein